VDELWQRYRAFWTPVLWGVGVFLVGLVVVHSVTKDPEEGRTANEQRAARLKSASQPTSAQTGALEASKEALVKRAEDWARKLDQRHGDDPDVVKAAVSQALRAAVARGRVPADPAAFDGDEAAAAQATAQYQALLAERLEQLQTQDPNVSFSRLQADVTQELAARANRADVDVADDQFGFAQITSVDRSELARRLLNLALVATVVDAAIREGVRSVDSVLLMPTETRSLSMGSDPFLQEWPVKVDLTGTPQALAQVLNVLTDPARPTALGATSWKQTGKKDGNVKAEMKLYSLRVRLDAPLGLETEAGE
jgi:hypothetical protein